MTDILSRVRRTIETHNLLAHGDAVIVGVSGGPDSLCLLHVLMRLREAYGLRLHVAHLNHGTRGADSDADADFVAGLAARWGLPCTIEKRDVPGLARAHKLAFEEAARRVRYAFLARVAAEVGATRIAVGHNADDQAETVLMHVLRGSGPAGLRGMLPATPITDYRLLEPFTEHEPRNKEQEARSKKQEARGKEQEARGRKQEAGSKGQEAGDKRPASCILHPASFILRPELIIIRPLLEVSRADIEAYCAEHGLEPRFDLSNLDTTYFRNRLRHELLPLLETYNPNIRARLCHTAAVVAADYELLADLRDRAWADVVREEREDTIVLDRAGWRALPVALQRAVLRRAAYALRRSLRDVDFVHVENARLVGLRGETGAQATLPMGLALTVGYETLTVGDAGEAGPPPDEPLLWSDEPLPVQVPGVTQLPQSEWALRAETVAQWDAAQIAANADPWTGYFDAERLCDPLVLRPRRRGDRFHPQGMGGHSVKLSAFLINLKVPRAWRDRVPLLVAGDEIAWVCGRRVGERFAVGPRTQRVARLQFERLTAPVLGAGLS